MERHLILIRLENIFNDLLLIVNLVLPLWINLTKDK